ncbi:ABC transporter ATP-binding protein [Thermoplasmatales archaeon SW_10_69_26]|nr:MAG: ABC transporter ATP-binding protein [Thermoplasmatales archaeon SW_10_69_26]
MPAVRVDDARKVYGDPPEGVVAVDGVSFSVDEGEVFGLLGPNGAGKTSLIRILSTLTEATSGRAEVAGVDVGEDPRGVRERIGLVFQEPSLDNLLTGRENLELSAALYDVSRRQTRERIDELLDLMDLAGRGDDPVKQYSGGMKRRLEIARGLLHDPEVLFLDEPTLGLDPQTRERLWAYIRSLREEGTTVLMTTHYMDEADALCDRVAVIDQGQIQALDDPEALKRELGGTVVHLRALGTSEDELAQAPGVEDVQAEGEGTFVVQLAGEVAQLPAFLRTLDEVDHLEVTTPTLQDVFLSLTGRHLRQGEAEGDGWTEDYQRMKRAE